MEIGGNGIHGASAPKLVIREQDLEPENVTILRKLALALTALVMAQKMRIAIPTHVKVSERLFCFNLIFENLYKIGARYKRSIPNNLLF